MTDRELRERTLEANLELVRQGLVLFTWGNVSLLCRERGVLAIKPSGVPYETLRACDIVLLTLEGAPLPGQTMRPSSDLPTHLRLLRAFPQIRSVVHTHSTYAAAFAQARMAIPCLGTTHADFLHGPVPVTREMTPEEVARDYEGETGAVIVEAMRGRDPLHTPACLVQSHGPFCWGADEKDAVYSAAVLEQVAHMAHLSLTLRPDLPPAPEHVAEKHFERKHGPGAYYGQK